MSSKYKHRKKHKRRLSTTAVISLLIIAAFIYVGTLIAVKYIGNHLELGDMQETVGSLDDRFAVPADQMITLNGETFDSIATGNGSLDAFANAVRKKTGLGFRLEHYSEHSLDQKGTGSVACSYVGLIWEDKTMTWGAGTDTDIINAGIRAMVSAVNNKL